MKRTLDKAICAGRRRAMLLMASCYGYRAVSFDRKIAPVNPDPVRDRLPAADEQAGRPRREKSRVSLHGVPLPGPGAHIVACGRYKQQGGRLAGQARYGEADILFREVIAEDPDMAAAYNNLGVVCELTGRRDEAFNRYSAACLKERDNAMFRRNFLGFADSMAGKQ